MTDLKAFIKLLESTVRADRLSGSKIKLLTEQSLQLVAQSTEVVTAFLRLNKSLHPATQQRISALYVFDAIARGVKDLERKEKREGGVEARGMLLRMEGAVDSLIEGMADDGTGVEWSEGREKAKKMIEIWTKNNTFPKPCLERLRAKITAAPPQAGPSTTPTASPPGSPGYMSAVYDASAADGAATAVAGAGKGKDLEPHTLSPRPAGSLPPEIAKLLGVASNGNDTPPPPNHAGGTTPLAFLSPGSAASTTAGPVDISAILASVRPTHLANSPAAGPAGFNAGQLSPASGWNIDPTQLAALARLAPPPSGPSFSGAPGGAMSPPPPSQAYQSQPPHQTQFTPHAPYPQTGRPGYGGSSRGGGDGGGGRGWRSPSPPRRDQRNLRDPRAGAGDGRQAVPNGSWQSRDRAQDRDTAGWSGPSQQGRQWDSGPRIDRRRSRSPQRPDWGSRRPDPNVSDPSRGIGGGSSGRDHPSYGAEHGRPNGPGIPQQRSIDPSGSQHLHQLPAQTPGQPHAQAPVQSSAHSQNQPQQQQDGDGEEDMALDNESDDETPGTGGPALARFAGAPGLPVRPDVPVPAPLPAPHHMPHPQDTSFSSSNPPHPTHPVLAAATAPSGAPPGTLAAFDPSSFNPGDPAAWAGLGRAWKAQTGREPGQMELMGFVMSGGKMGPGSMDAGGMGVGMGTGMSGAGAGVTGVSGGMAMNMGGGGYPAGGGGAGW